MKVTTSKRFKHRDMREITTSRCSEHTTLALSHLLAPPSSYINYFYIWAYQSNSTLIDRKREQNPRVVIAILIANATSCMVTHTMAAYLLTNCLKHFNWQVSTGIKPDKIKKRQYYAQIKLYFFFKFSQ